MISIVRYFILLVFLFKVGSCNFAPGSYPYAETYELNYSEEKVKNAISKFKKKHLKYIVPKVTINGQGSWDLTDEQTKNPSHWFKVYFYYKDKESILFTWIRPSGKNKTIFAFVSINKGLDIGNWKEINKDLSRSESKDAKREFEKRILNPIREYLKRNN